MFEQSSPELMPELVPVSEEMRQRLPRWDPRIWGNRELLEVASIRPKRVAHELIGAFGRLEQKLSLRRRSLVVVRVILPNRDVVEGIGLEELLRLKGATR
jgi:hypothetical protein